MPTTEAISIYRGEDVVLSFTMNPVVNITGWTITFQLREYDGTTELLTKSASVTDGPNGVFTVALADDDTDALEDVYHYDVWREDPGAESVLAIGELTVLPVARVTT